MSLHTSIKLCCRKKTSSLLNVARALRFQSNLPIQYWGECFLTVMYLINKLRTLILSNRSPHETLFETFLCNCYFTNFFLDGFLALAISMLRVPLTIASKMSLENTIKDSSSRMIITYLKILEKWHMLLSSIILMVSVLKNLLLLNAYWDSTFSLCYEDIVFDFFHLDIRIKQIYINNIIKINKNHGNLNYTLTIPIVKDFNLILVYHIKSSSVLLN